VATAAAAVAGFNEIDLAFARYKANADGKRLMFFFDFILQICRSCEGANTNFRLVWSSIDFAPQTLPRKFLILVDENGVLRCIFCTVSVFSNLLLFFVLSVLFYSHDQLCSLVVCRF